MRARRYLIHRLENVTKRKVTIASLDVIPPLRIYIKKLEIEGLAKVESVTIAPSLVRLLMTITAFNEINIVNPEITINRPLEKKVTAPAEQQAPAAPVTEGQEVEPKPEPVKKHLPFLIFQKVSIKGGKINFIDPNARASGIKIEIKISICLRNLYLYPLSAVTNFKLTGKIPWRDGGRRRPD